jgi:lon-related putative ATP-dependent protease
MPKLELTPSELRSPCDPNRFTFRDTSQLTPLDEVIGQERAVQAIEFGLNMRSPGYNIFVTGAAGTGKSNIVQELVGRHARLQPVPDDWCLVNNFQDEFRPRAVALPPGRGPAFAKRIARLVAELRKDIPRCFEEEVHLKRLSLLKARAASRQQRIFQKVERLAAGLGLHLDPGRTEFPVLPVVDGKPLPPEEVQRLPRAARAAVDAGVSRVQAEMERAGRRIEKVTAQLRADIERLMNDSVAALLRRRLQPVRRDFRDRPGVLEFLDALEADVVESFNLFVPGDPVEPPAAGEAPPVAQPPLQRYQVNVLAHRRLAGGAPVVLESNPSYGNVFGRIEKRATMGGVNTDFTLVMAGALLAANGGFLIMEIEPLLTHPGVWEALKRALQTKRLAIEDLPEESGPGTTSLKPEPIPLEVKVILLGSYEAFEELQNFDSRFNRIFRVRADFDDEVEHTQAAEERYARFVARVCREEGLLPFNRRGVAAVVEFGRKHVSDQRKLTLQFGRLVAVLKEADYWARRQRARVVSEAHVVRAFQEHRFRYSLYEQKVHEAYRDGSILMDVSGAVVGQVNGLAVYQIGDYAFGRPVRITAATFMGRPGVINVEREADLSGRTHDKGVLILSGFLGSVFAQRHPLHLSISIAFEQSYTEIDGDSASSAELYAILSSLARIPVRQGIAVTGSVNQKGRVQAIGGVNQKIEGFFEVCREKGLTGEQGVIMPVSNVRNLMLRREVVDAVRKRQFHVYRVSTVEEGIEILTGVRAGRPGPEGRFPRGTVFGEVQATLETYADRYRRAKPPAGEGDG